MGILLRNWHLKLSAILLSTVLYTGLVFSGSFSDAEIQVRITQTNASRDAYVLTGDLGFVTVRYRVANDQAGAIAADAFQIRPGLGIHLTASVGLATLECPEDTPETVFRRADNALFAAKRRGRNRVSANAA